MAASRVLNTKVNPYPLRLRHVLSTIIRLLRLRAAAAAAPASLQRSIQLRKWVRSSLSKLSGKT